MMKQALGILMVLAALGWVAGCSAGGTATPSATPAATATPEAKPESAAAPKEEPKTEEPKAEVKPESVPQGAAVMTTISGVQMRIVYFDFDKYNIKPEFMDDIKYNAEQMKLHPDMKVTVEGHCDERGSTEYNLALGERRATAVEKAMVAQGVTSARMKVVSYGEERPVDPGHTEEAWAKNRRSDLTQ